MGVEQDFYDALFDRLSGSIGATVYDVAPQADDGGDDSVFPYVTIGEIVMTDLGTQTKNGWSALCRIHVWSRTGSQRECRAILGAIYDLLHERELIMPLHTNYSLRCESSEPKDEGDDIVHGVCEYRALIERKY